MVSICNTSSSRRSKELLAHSRGEMSSKFVLLPWAWSTSSAMEVHTGTHIPHTRVHTISIPGLFPSPAFIVAWFQGQPGWSLTKTHHPHHKPQLLSFKAGLLHLCTADIWARRFFMGAWGAVLCIVRYLAASLACLLDASCNPTPVVASDHMWFNNVQLVCNDGCTILWIY